MAASSPWGNISSKPIETMSFAEIMSEEYAQKVQDKEIKRYEEKLLDQKHNVAESNSKKSYAELAAALEEKSDWEDYSELLEETEQKLIPPEILEALKDDTGGIDGEIDSDAVIAQMLQSQYDHEYNEELRRIEQKRNKESKVRVTLDKYRLNGDIEFLNDTKGDTDEEDEDRNKDWDRFETNDKILGGIPKCGFKVNEDGEMITKHDAKLCGVRNACKVMSFPPEFSTGDGAGFEMKLDNRVYNQLKTYSRRIKKNNVHDRKEGYATAEMGVDVATRLLLYKLINNQILEQINGIISTGKEAVILHANSDPNYSGEDSHSNGGFAALMPAHLLPKECAVKIFKTTLNEFKQRDRYIKDDYRFKDRMSKQKHALVINMWAEKEMHNMMRMQSVGINCPDIVVLKKHVLVMSFIGDNHNAAPKLKDARLNEAELCMAYEEVISAMHKLYNEAKLVHADLSEYNILWYKGKCWFIDVAQSVEPEHPSALEFLMRDCSNIINFFTKRGLPNIYTNEELFKHITGLEVDAHNVGMLERIHTRGATRKQATAPNMEDCPEELKPLNYPFDLAWEKSQADRKKHKKSTSEIDQAANAMQVLSVHTDDKLHNVTNKENSISSQSSLPKNANKKNTANI